MFRYLAFWLFISQNSFGAMGGFVEIYKSLKIKRYSLSQEENINNFFEFFKIPELTQKVEKLKKLSRVCTKPIECNLKQFEVNRLSKRIHLIEKLKTNGVTNYKQLKNNPDLLIETYKHTVFEWTNDPNYSFEELKRYQKNEIKKIRSKLKKIGPSVEKKINNEQLATLYLQKVKKIVEVSLASIITKKKIPDFQIKKNTNKNMQHVPGYYDSQNKTFYYTLFPEGTKLGDLDWLLLHEASPGHHLQSSLNKHSLANKLFSKEHNYLDYSEGWAAYVETFGKEFDLYKTNDAYKRALEWDLVRSIRVIIDIGLNSENWTDKKALKYWKNNAPEVFHLANREIKRMRNWPGQVISYEYGKMKIIEARELYLKNNKSILGFHEKLLNVGQIPTSLIKNIVVNN